jgi:hypothetical protein
MPADALALKTLLSPGGDRRLDVAAAVVRSSPPCFAR